MNVKNNGSNANCLVKVVSFARSEKHPDCSSHVAETVVNFGLQLQRRIGSNVATAGGKMLYELLRKYRLISMNVK